jgi:queuine tRNA-ribosyltransferase
MPVGTAGAVKGVTPEYLEASGAEIILANTYHLMLRPGVEVVQSLGGLHRLMAWNRPILTDSGGYQVFSLGELTKIDDEGVEFASHVDGARVRLNAEVATEVQFRMGSDIIMCFDECTQLPADKNRLQRAADRTTGWAKRCSSQFSVLISQLAADNRQPTTDNRQLLFGIVQGGTDLDLRRRCAEQIVDIGFDGYALGGLSVGEGHEEMVKTVRYTAPLLPVDRPRYLMGVGRPQDILDAVATGIDMFDCVLPTRNGRNATCLTAGGPVKLRNAAHRFDPRPIEESCDCLCCRRFSRAYMRHLFLAKEMLGPILASIHNVAYLQRLTRQIREAIFEGRFVPLRAEVLEALGPQRLE